MYFCTGVKLLSETTEGAHKTKKKAKTMLQRCVFLRQTDDVGAQAHHVSLECLPIEKNLNGNQFD